MYVSIVIPFKNREKTLTRCIKSILEQTYHDFELLLVNDHSDDNSCRIAEAWSRKDSRVRLVHSDRFGAQAARNAGIMAATYEWIVFQDSDDIWLKDLLKKELNILKDNKYSDKTVVFSDCYTYNVTSRRKEYWALPVFSPSQSYKFLLTHTAPTYDGLLCSKRLLKSIGYLDEQVPAFQEWDTSISLAKEGAVFYHIRKPMFVYFIGGDDTISSNGTKELKGMLYIRNKYDNDIRSALPKCLVELYDLCITYRVLSIIGDMDSARINNLIEPFPQILKWFMKYKGTTIYNILSFVVKIIKRIV